MRFYRCNFAICTFSNMKPRSEEGYYTYLFNDGTSRVYTEEAICTSKSVPVPKERLCIGRIPKDEARKITSMFNSREPSQYAVAEGSDLLLYLGSDDVPERLEGVIERVEEIPSKPVPSGKPVIKYSPRLLRTITEMLTTAAGQPPTKARVIYRGSDFWSGPTRWPDRQILIEVYPESEVPGAS